MKGSIFVVALLVACAVAFDADRVNSLPDMGNFTDYGVFSGYLKIPYTTKSLHYLLVESASKPDSDPLMVWFNGGPGCSSMLAFAQEHGPYAMEDGADNFQKNEWSWNRDYNMLYIESPAGVGYSRVEDASEAVFDDDLSGKDNYQALKAFFEKYPDFVDRDLYIAGESYAGIYVPFLASEVIRQNSRGEKPMNLKGIMVGNGVTNWKFDCNPAYQMMAFWHNMYDISTAWRMKKEKCVFENFGNITEECGKIWTEFMKTTERVNVYDIYRHCYDNEEKFATTFLHGKQHTYKVGATAADYTPWLYNPETRAKLGLDATPVGIVPPCVYGAGVTKYFNRKDVRSALNIHFNDQPWELCTDRIQYNIGIDASQAKYDGIKEAGVRILHFSGDTDGAVPTLGTRKWIEEMGWPLKKQFRTWLMNDQVAGFIEEFEGLTLAIVHGVGHMAPQWARENTYTLIDSWIKGKKI